tara:strand:+ start:3803 stop:4819 length:1017 start_codon:yes stop_codon:yes gene_type:complete
MADLTIDDIVKDADTYLPANTEIIAASVNRMDIALDQHTKPITKVKGLYPQGAALITNVVQGFAPVWNDMGSVQIDHKILKNYRHKVNFGFTPDEVQSSYWAYLYEEGKSVEDMPITKFVVEVMLLPKVVDDIATLSVKGVYNGAALGTFGNAMNGIEKILLDLFAGVPATDHTPFKIPLTALTDTNIVDQVTAFERTIPSKLKNKIKKIFMSENNKERYIIQYEEQFGANLLVNKDKATTRVGNREIVGLPGMDTDDIFATVDGNFVRLVDFFDGKPAVTDVQKADYTVKYFMEFWKGYDFLVNELVLVANYTDAEYGLGSTVLNQKYYGIDGVTVV